jgi:type VI secretion system protein ImpC
MATETAAARSPQDAQVETRDANEFAALLKQSFKPRTERAATEVDNAVRTLVEQALADTSLIKSDVLDTIEEMIAQLDKKLTVQLNEIMHAPEFQQIESAWRGLKYLIFQSETDAQLKIRVMNVSKNELYNHLRQYPNAAWDQSALFKKLYKRSSASWAGSPMAA